MEIKAGSFLSGAATNLKYYREEEVETSTYKLERVFSGTKLTLRLFVKDANAQDVVELIPQGSVTKVYFLRMGLDLKSGLASNVISGAGTFSVIFNNLTVDGVSDSHTFSNWATNDSDEFKREENSVHTYHALHGVGLHPLLTNKPLTVQLNSDGAVYSAGIQYELLLEFNYYDK